MYFFPFFFSMNIPFGHVMTFASQLQILNFYMIIHNCQLDEAIFNMMQWLYVLKEPKELTYRATYLMFLLSPL